MKPQIFIDGDEGTTGLKIQKRLRHRSDLEIIKINPKKRKDSEAKKKFYHDTKINLAILCLPDAAAREAAGFIDRRRTKIIDCSNAHRLDWVYGLPELRQKNRSYEKYRELIKTANCVSGAGCHSAAVLLILNPLSLSGLIDPKLPVFCWSISGFSGGGKKMIKKYKSLPPNSATEVCCREISLNAGHKHLPEMQKYSFLEREPTFLSFVEKKLYQGMKVGVSLVSDDRGFFTPEMIRSELEKTYRGEKFVRVAGQEETEKIGDGLSAQALVNTNRVEIHVYGKPGVINIVALLDNLGKGSSGNAVQCLNLMLGKEETTGLL
ncbi:MAG: N-acetyl-gamma-glutamyl-phosphate reductase [Patescibacteria group bacterium]|nr:N-acetyl-gamma-glutamyl-phosphate reductase [Patescibacteria group bacterium]